MSKSKAKYGIVNGQWVVNCGNAETKSGSIRPKTHYLGTVKEDPKALQADLLAATIRNEWAALKATGATLWPKPTPKPSEATGAASVGAVDGGSPTAAPGSQVSAAPASLTVKQLGARFMDAKRKVTGGSEGNVATWGYWIDAIVRILGEDRKVAAVDAKAVSEAVQAICKRPLTVRKVRLSVATAKTYLKVLRALLRFATDETVWTAPKGYLTIFKTNRIERDEADKRKAHDKRSGKASEVETFTVDELSTLYGGASKYHRLFMLLALNCGFANMEIATLKTYEILWDGRKIGRIRGKTEKANDGEGVWGEWPLWDETADLLRQFQAPKNTADLMLVSHHGSPLITRSKSGKGRNDAIRSAWEYVYSVLNRKAPRFLPFKHLRKTGAKIIRDKYGAETASAYLSHSDDGQGDDQLTAYADRNWSKVAEAVKDLRSQLQPMFDAAKVADEKKQFGKTPRVDMFKAREALNAKRKADALLAV